jgi:hypothetical protein
LGVYVIINRYDIIIVEQNNMFNKVH